MIKLSFLKEKSWKEITREERFFCAELYFFFKDCPEKLVALLSESGTVPCIEKSDLGEKWSLDYEVCFFRDIIYHYNSADYQNMLDLSNRGLLNIKDYSPKRTFDLCLFSERKIIVIEAKVQQSFHKKQLDDFITDKERLKKLSAYINLPEVKLVALGSSKYFDRLKGRPLPDVFSNNFFTWKDIYDYCTHEIFSIADNKYGN